MIPSCAWCEQPLADGPLRAFGQLRCDHCGATTALDWPVERDLQRVTPGAPLPQVHGARRICTLGEAARRRVRRRLATRIARVAPPGPVLDVSSGDRQLLDALRATGRLTTGIVSGPSTGARTGVQHAEITELGGRYAAIVFWQSLGRLHAPGVALEHAAALLKPGGLLAIAQPSPARLQARAIGDLLLAPGVPQHRVVIPPQTLLERLRALGLQADRIDHLLDLPTPGGWVQSVLGGVTAIEARR
jgi:hypothetical protein